MYINFLLTIQNLCSKLNTLHQVTDLLQATGINWILKGDVFFYGRSPCIPLVSWWSNPIEWNDGLFLVRKISILGQPILFQQVYTCQCSSDQRYPLSIGRRLSLQYLVCTRRSTLLNYTFFTRLGHISPYKISNYLKYKNKNFNFLKRKKEKPHAYKMQTYNRR